MKTVQLTDEQVNALPPEDIVLAIWIGSDDILVDDVAEAIERFQKDGVLPSGPVSNIELLDKYLEDVSGNGREVMALWEGKIVKVSFV
jgi:predicted hydrocarbon binding protein